MLGVQVRVYTSEGACRCVYALRQSVLAVSVATCDDHHVTQRSPRESGVADCDRECGGGVCASETRGISVAANDVNFCRSLLAPS